VRSPHKHHYDNADFSQSKNFSASDDEALGLAATCIFQNAPAEFIRTCVYLSQTAEAAAVSGRSINIQQARYVVENMRQALLDSLS
jgi:hypothetical protein